MKRAIDPEGGCTTSQGEPVNKVVLVESSSIPSGVNLVNPSYAFKPPYTDVLELSDRMTTVNTAIKSNARNKLDIIGRQMKNLHELMTEVYEETKLSVVLHNVACNFVKKPGHVYHLYERPSGQKYLGMLSPEEWPNSPHAYLGSFLLNADSSWSPTTSNIVRYEGVEFLQQMSNTSLLPSIL